MNDPDRQFSVVDRVDDAAPVDGATLEELDPVVLDNQRHFRAGTVSASVVAGVPPRAARRERILEPLLAGPISLAEVASVTGLTDATVRRWPAIMREDGFLAPTGYAAKSPRSRYVHTEQGS